MRAAFCHTMIWITHKYTYYLLPLSWASLPPFLHSTSVGYHRGQNWTPCVIKQLPTTIYFTRVVYIWASQVVLVVRNLPANTRDIKDSRKILWRRAQQPISVFLPRESHGQRTLACYSPQGHTKSDMTEVT